MVNSLQCKMIYLNADYRRMSLLCMRILKKLEEKGFITKEMRYRKTANDKNHQTSNLYHIEPLPI